MKLQDRHQRLIERAAGRYEHRRRPNGIPEPKFSNEGTTSLNAESLAKQIIAILIDRLRLQPDAIIPLEELVDDFAKDGDLDCGIAAATAYGWIESVDKGLRLTREGHYSYIAENSLQDVTCVIGIPGSGKWVSALLQMAHRPPLGPRVCNKLAREVMGWKLQPGDRRRLWRHSDGTPVEWVCHDGQTYTLCAHPWVNGVNDDFDVSFAPWPNYHRKDLEDWERVVLSQAEKTKILSNPTPTNDLIWGSSMVVKQSQAHKHLDKANSLLYKLAEKAGVSNVRLEITDSMPGIAATDSTPACSNSYLRLIYVSSQALDTLDQGETVLRCILAHEVGHIALKHYYWDSVFSDALLWGAIPLFLALWWLSKSSLIAGAVVVVIILLRMMVVQRAALRAENYREINPQEKAADEFAANLVGEDNWRQYLKDMEPRPFTRSVA